MARGLFVALSSVALLLVLGETLGAALLWSQGKLNADSLREIRAILQEDWGSTGETAAGEKKPAVAVEDVIATRSIRILHLEEREREQDLLKALVADSRTSILKEQDALALAQQQFETKRKTAEERAASESIAQSRAVLMKTDAATSMAQLMELSLDESVELISGMPEKKIAELLQTFAGGDKEQMTRGQEIFQAITRGRIDQPLSPPQAPSAGTPGTLQ